MGTSDLQQVGQDHKGQPGLMIGIRSGGQSCGPESLTVGSDANTELSCRTPSGVGELLGSVGKVLHIRIGTRIYSTLISCGIRGRQN